MLFRALRRRFAWRGSLAHCGVLLCALAALLKPAMFAMPWFVDGGLWYRWAPVLEWLAFIFEYLLGAAIQIYLILLAYCWVRGITFSTQHLRDFAIRRFSLVMRWALVVVALSSVLINLPLIFKNFDFVGEWLGREPRELERWIVDFWIVTARGILAAILHPLRDHADHAHLPQRIAAAGCGRSLPFRSAALVAVWLVLLIALVHCFFLHFLNALLSTGFRRRNRSLGALEAPLSAARGLDRRVAAGELGDRVPACRSRAGGQDGMDRVLDGCDSIRIRYSVVRNPADELQICFFP